MTFAARVIGVVGALYGASAVALSAYASHGLAAHLTPALLQRTWLAIVMLIAHALLLVAIAALARAGAGLLLLLAAGAIALGSALFCGSLLGSAVFGWSGALAPAGGTMMIVGWMLLAVWFAGAKR